MNLRSLIFAFFWSVSICGLRCSTVTAWQLGQSAAKQPGAGTPWLIPSPQLPPQLPPQGPAANANPLGANPAAPNNAWGELPSLRMAQRTNDSPVRLPQDEASYPDFLPDAIEDDQLLIGGPKLSAYKSGFFQKLSASGTWLPGMGSNQLGIVESEVFVTVALPAPTTEWPLLITPYLNVRTLDGPTTPDLPANLFEAYVDFMWVPRINDRWIGIIAVTPSVYSDFDGDHPDAFRWQGKGMARWDIVPDQLQLLFGVLYLNRENIRTLPAGGLIWKPNPDMNYELVFPRPKLAHRLRFGDTWEDWIYVAGEFGGNSFAVRRADGSEDMATLRDWRIMLGVERKRDGGAGQRLEFGYIFSRQVEYRSSTPDFNPDDTLMVRLVLMF